uniref:Uncharacterized protein n=1 Tax=Anguilla anguilla TaxID=7936 RepID=A0A0E9UJK6_ANGAN
MMTLACRTPTTTIQYRQPILSFRAVKAAE